MNFELGAETFSIVSCSTRDTSPRDLCVMTLIDPDAVRGSAPEFFNLTRKDYLSEKPDGFGIHLDFSIIPLLL